MTDQIRTIAVIGAGLMGRGIAGGFAIAGFRVHLTDSSPTALQAAHAAIAVDIADATNSSAIRDLVSCSVSLIDSVATADFVVEAVTEDLALKQRVFAELDQHAPAHAILASNTSSFMPSQLASSTKRPAQVLVTHYFNPPLVVRLVEIVQGPETSPETVETVRSLYAQIGKIPVVLEKERLGFIGNRLQMALFREALALVDEGVASVEDVDLVIHTSIGPRWSVAGVFEVLDLAGLDTVLAVATQLYPDLSNATVPPDSLKQRVARGDLGIKSGKGFYDWPPEHAEEARARVRRGLTNAGR